MIRCSEKDGKARGEARERREQNAEARREVF